MCILAVYVLLGLATFLGFYIAPVQKNNPSAESFISIIIPFRNEEKNLPRLIESLKKLAYPAHLYEIIFVDDHSIDQGAKLIQQSGLQNYACITSTAEGKKSAIALGVTHACGSLIVATDADCIVPPGWLEQISQVGENALVLGPVQLSPVKNFLHVFQDMEWAALQSISAAGVYWKMPLMSNGANMAYPKKKFSETALKNQTPSGDDIFLLEDFKRRKLPIVFIWKTASIVQTPPAPSMRALVQQRVRWASKSRYYTNYLNTALGILIACTNLVVLAHLVNIGCMSSTAYFSMMIITTKMIADILLMLPYLILVKRSWLVFIIPVFLVLYPFYFIYILALSLRGKFTWKERHYKA